MDTACGFETNRRTKNNAFGNTPGMRITRPLGVPSAQKVCAINATHSFEVAHLDRMTPYSRDAGFETGSAVAVLCKQLSQTNRNHVRASADYLRPG